LSLSIRIAKHIDTYDYGERGMQNVLRMIVGYLVNVLANPERAKDAGAGAAAGALLTLSLVVTINLLSGNNFGIIFGGGHIGNGDHNTTINTPQIKNSRVFRILCKSLRVTN
jgi:hypothetical protein